MEATDRIERLLALLLLAQMKGTAQRERIHQLSLGGFSNIEIADLLETTPAVVSQGIYEAKSSRRKKTPSRSSSKSSAKAPKG